MFVFCDNFMVDLVCVFSFEIGSRHAMVFEYLNMFLFKYNLLRRGTRFPSPHPPHPLNPEFLVDSLVAAHVDAKIYKKYQSFEV